MSAPGTGSSAPKDCTGGQGSGWGRDRPREAGCFVRKAIMGMAIGEVKAVVAAKLMTCKSLRCKRSGVAQVDEGGECYNGRSDRFGHFTEVGGDLASTGVRDRGTRAEVSIALVKPVENSQLRILTTLSLLNNQ